MFNGRAIERLDGSVQAMDKALRGLLGVVERMNDHQHELLVRIEALERASRQHPDLTTPAAVNIEKI
jgi:hypothetical protein